MKRHVEGWLALQEARARAATEAAELDAIERDVRAHVLSAR